MRYKIEKLAKTNEIDVLEEILNYNEPDEQKKVQNKRNCEIRKEIIEQYYK